MTINVLICRPDGSQVLETREVPEDYFAENGPAPLTDDELPLE